MNTRSTKKKAKYSKITSVQMDQSETKSRSTTSSDTDNDENSDDAQFERFPSPTFNIHIHVPYYDTKSSKLFLPRIQPIINLHFDELARKLESNRNKRNEKSLSKTFQNLLPKISPKFGVVKFHFKNNSEERDTEDCEINNVTLNSSQRHSNDFRKNKIKNSNNIQNVNAEIIEDVLSSCGSNNNSNAIDNSNNKSKICKSNDCSDHALTSYELDKDVKLKKAVVLLTDVCKSKNYKHFFENNSFCKTQSNENESSSNFEDELENNCSEKQKYEGGMCSLKTEVESFTSESCTTEWNENNIGISENCFADNDANLITEENINNKSNIIKICNEKDQNFTALVEGWSFSDILNRFQVKYNEKLGNCEASSSFIIKNRNNNSEMDNDNKLNHEVNEVINENECIEQDFEKEPNSVDELHVKINKSETNLNEEDCFDKTVSDATKSYSFVQNETINDEADVLSDGSMHELKNLTKEDIEPTESYSFVQNETVNDEADVLSDGSMHELKNLTKEDIEPEFTSDSVNSGSDDCKIASVKEVSKGIVDMEVVEHDVSSISSNAFQEIKFEVPEMNKSSLLNVTHPGFHLELIKREVERRAMSSTPINKAQKNLKSDKSDKSVRSCIESPSSSSTPLSKKMKLSDGKPKTPEQNTMKSSQTKDFISLKSYGPTEFSVAALNKITPSKSEAKDFKKNMLFGNRVNRFSSSEQLRIYQLKREAARKSLKN